MTSSDDIELSEQLATACASGSVEDVQRLMELGASPRYAAALPLRCAAAEGQAECIQALLAAKFAQQELLEALRLAARRGRMDCAKILLSHVDASLNNSWPLREAAIAGHSDMVRLLVGYSNLGADGLAAIILSAENRHEECLSLLLSAVCPSPRELAGARAAANRRGAPERIIGMIASFEEARELQKSARRPAGSKRISRAL